ncbi:MAG TPA: hypothetical protein VE996_07615 [Terriglobales bacterium]|nr:hypothetical protein [Terriglobales bacterium]
MVESEATGTARGLLAGLIDYAGLFPPARLGMREAVAAYAAERRGPYAWVLARFVVAAERLEEFAAARAALKRGGGIWPLSVIVHGDRKEGPAQLFAFNDAHAAHCRIEAVEFRANGVAEIAACARIWPAAFERYCELPLASTDWARCLPPLRAAGLRVKIRTGGLVPEAFPATGALARFLLRCADAGLTFKATAGLHHALRGAYALSPEPASPRVPMHGFLNLVLACAYARRSWDAARLEAVLLETSANAFTFDGEGAAWRGERLSAEELALARRAFFQGFGSCSIAEPIGELRALQLL